MIFLHCDYWTLISPRYSNSYHGDLCAYYNQSPYVCFEICMHFAGLHGERYCQQFVRNLHIHHRSRHFRQVNTTWKWQKDDKDQHWERGRMKERERKRKKEREGQIGPDVCMSRKTEDERQSCLQISVHLQTHHEAERGLLRPIRVCSLF